MRPRPHLIAFLALAASCHSSSQPKAAPAPTAAPESQETASYERLVRTAQHYASLGKTERALELLDEAAAREPERPEAHALHGLLLAERGALKESAPYYEKALASGSRDPRVFAELASIYDVTKQYQKALAVYDAFLAQDPTNRDMRHQRALTLLIVERTEEACRELEALAQQDPNDDQVSQDLGYALLQSGDPERAASVLEKVVTKNPGRLDAVFFLARAFVAAGKLEEALAHLERLLAADPEAHQPALLRARLLLFLDRLDDAQLAYEAILERHPTDSPGAALGLAGVLIAKNQLPEATKIVERLRVGLGDDHPRIRLREAQIAWRKGQRAAVKDVLAYARQNPTDIEVWRDVDAAARRWKDKKLAREAVQHIHELQPSH